MPLKHVRDGRARLRGLEGCDKSRREDYPQVPKESLLWPLMEKCWEYEPTDRPRIRQVLEELKELDSRETVGWPGDDGR